MSVVFPSVEFFQALRDGLAKDPPDEVEPSEAYCGFSIGDELFVFEFDGHGCAAVIKGGNPIDLDFVISGPLESWRQAIAKGDPKPLAELIDAGSLTTASDAGEEAAQPALPMLQAFVDEAQKFDSELA